MTWLSPTARRFPRRAVVVFLVFLMLSAVAPARGAGTGGIEVTPLPATVDGKTVTAFRVELPGSGSKEVEFLLRNVEDGERSAELYAAEATRSPDGSFAIGDPGSSPFLSYERRSVTLPEGEQRVESFRLQRPDGEQPTEEVYGAIVVQVSSGSIVQRAATLVYIKPGRQLPVPLPLLIVLVAAALVLAAAIAVVIAARRRRRPVAPESAAA